LILVEDQRQQIKQRKDGDQLGLEKNFLMRKPDSKIRRATVRTMLSSPAQSYLVQFATEKSLSYQGRLDGTVS